MLLTYTALSIMSSNIVVYLRSFSHNQHKTCAAYIKTISSRLDPDQTPSYSASDPGPSCLTIGQHYL